MNHLPLLWLSLSFLSGLIIASLIPLQNSTTWFLIGSGILLTILEKMLAGRSDFIAARSKISPLPVGILLAALSLGLLRLQTTKQSMTSKDLAWYNDQGNVTIFGQVISPPVKNSRFTQVRILAEQLSLSGEKISLNNAQSISDKALLWIPNYLQLEYGDRLQVTGKLQTPEDEEDFSYKDYLARQAIHSLMLFPKIIVLEKGTGNPILAGIYGFRDRAYQMVNQLFPMPESSLFSGILLGIQGDIPETLYQSYQVTGTAHIIVISGFNISIIAALFTRLFRRILPYGWDALASISAIGLYTILVGAQPPVIRAAIMGSLAIPAYLIGRKVIGLHALALTAAIMAFFNPGLLQDVSFQLSFLATLGIFVFTEPLNNIFNKWSENRFSQEQGKGLKPFISEYFLVTLAAQFATLPVIIEHFGFVSLLALPANLLILPFQPPIIVMGGIAVLAGMLLQPLGQLIAFFAWLPAAYTNKMIEFLAGFPGTVLGVSRLWVWISLLALILALIPAIHDQFSPKKPIV